MSVVRAYRLHDDQTGRLDEVPDPEPGPGEVVVRVGGAGLCHSDLHVLHDIPPELIPWPLPFTLGHEIAGWVDSVGSGVEGVEVGTPVAVYGPLGCRICRSCRQGAENLCESGLGLASPVLGLGVDGGLADKVRVTDPRHLVPLGELDPIQAAALSDAGLTTYHAISRARDLLVPGAVAVVIGIGGLGHMAVEILAETSPVDVVAVDVRDDALELARQRGATACVTSGEDVVAEVLDATGGRGARLVLDTVGNDATLALATAVARGPGQVTMVGIGGGTVDFGYFTAPPEVSFSATFWGTLPELGEVVDLAAAGRLSAHVERIGLDEVGAAYDRLHRGEVLGRAVAVP